MPTLHPSGYSTPSVLKVDVATSGCLFLLACWILLFDTLDVNHLFRTSIICAIDVAYTNHAISRPSQAHEPCSNSFILVCYLIQLPIIAVVTYVIAGLSAFYVDMRFTFLVLIFGFLSCIMVLTEMFIIMKSLDQDEPHSLKMFILRCLMNISWIGIVAGFVYSSSPMFYRGPRAHCHWAAYAAAGTLPFCATLLFLISSTRGAPGIQPHENDDINERTQLL